MRCAWSTTARSKPRWGTAGPRPGPWGGLDLLVHRLSNHRRPRSVAALGVGQRTVFNAFFGISPSAFQRALQLGRVCRPLLSAPPYATVTTLALDEGVQHLGRFAGAYRRQFGELPSATLRRAQEARRPVAAYRRVGEARPA